ncbi:MAG: glycosyltransferase family 2 protein [Myxococcaceae bacterium]
MRTAIVVLSALWWLAQALLHLRTRSALPKLRDLNAPALPRWPKVSAVIPARNEEAHLAAALEAKRADGYPELELVVVNDRSTDRTGAIADELAARDPRLRAVHVTALPDGWLGKVNALQRGLEQASGEWILFSDADVHLAPGTLVTLISWAELNDIDHVTIFPGIRARGPLIAPALASFARFLTTLLRLWRVPDPKSNVSVGAGAFQLFRRRSLDATAGLEWLKMEIGDDMALGMMLKRAGARQAIVVGGDEVGLEFYPSFISMAHALEKNGAAAPLPALLFGLTGYAACEAGFVLGFGTSVGWLSALTLLIAAATQWSTGRWLAVPAWPAMVPWFGALPLTAVLLRSAVLAFVRGGVNWRDTFYSTQVVREGMRVGKKEAGGVSPLPRSGGGGVTPPTAVLAPPASPDRTSSP